MTPELLRADPRIVLTLDAGGSSFRFSATRGGVALVDRPPVAPPVNDLDRCLQCILDGFAAVRARCPDPPVAISFAFPGPADYINGIIGDLPNFPGFRGGVALGPMLADAFGLPVYINNDGGLFASGEASGGFLPWVNAQLAAAANARRYMNLLGVTLGTGLGGGFVHEGRLLAGDNASAGHIYLLRNKMKPASSAEDGASIRAVQRVYAELAAVPPEAVPDPKTIARIARGDEPGSPEAALESYRQLGEVTGDAIAQALTVVDGVVVIGGGLAGAADLFLPPLVAAMNAPYPACKAPESRLGPKAFSVEDPTQLKAFLAGTPRTVQVPGSARAVIYDPSRRTAVGLTRLGTSAAIAFGAYAVALRALDDRS